MSNRNDGRGDVSATPTVSAGGTFVRPDPFDGSMREPEPFVPPPAPQSGGTMLGAGNPTAPFTVPAAEELPNVLLVFRRVGRKAFLAMAQALVDEAEQDATESESIAAGNRCRIGGMLKPWIADAREIGGDEIFTVGGLWPAIEKIMELPAGGREHAWKELIQLMNQMSVPGPSKLVDVITGLTARGY